VKKVAASRGILTNLKVTQRKQMPQKHRQGLNGPLANKITALFPKNYLTIKKNLVYSKVSKDNLVL
jgi:hypothetical protein